MTNSRIKRLLAETNNFGETALHAAAQHNDDNAITNVLLDAGAEVDARDYRGRTPLHFTGLHNAPVDIVESLIENGADVKVRDYNGATPLHFAMVFSCREVSITLESAGADCEAVDFDGRTPHDYVELALTDLAFLKSLKAVGDELSAEDDL